ncbi:MAG TPA: SEC-C metal-binding domain-containing protein [Haliangium sp.]|nr:SEC-C metal-binding domain-containing protein [Haliangium sp.]
MGHDIHFLERLERLSMPQADFALALYRDPDLVRFVLANVKLPDGAERVALAVEHKPDTPYIIVARDGGFVTCLGKDMSVSDHVVVSRERLDRLAAERAEFRQALARVNDAGSSRQIFRRLYRSGPALPREDIRTLRAVYPLYWAELLHEAIALGNQLQEFRARYRGTHYRRLSAVAREALRGYWQASWALGHLVALHGTVAREATASLLPKVAVEEQMGLCASWLTTRTMSTPLVLRGAWAASRAGHELLPVYRRKFEGAATLLSFLDSVVGLTAIGLRHRKLRGEVRKFLARRRNPALVPDAPYVHGARMRLLLPLYEKTLEDDGAEGRTLHRHIGVELLRSVREASAPDHPIHSLAPSGDEVPDEIAYLLPLLIDTSLHGDGEAQILLPLLMAWVVDADIEQLYFPANTLARLHVDVSLPPERILAHLDDYALYMNRGGPARREAAPGRNEPCSCGSGKKYKRCCGAGEAAP